MEQNLEIEKKGEKKDLNGQNKIASNYTVLLDTGATKSILHPSILTDLRPTSSAYTIHGISGQKIPVNVEGMFENLHRVLASEKVNANILSFSELEDAGGDFTFLPHNGFTYLKDGIKHSFKKNADVYQLVNIQENDDICVDIKTDVSSSTSSFAGNVMAEDNDEEIYLSTITERKKQFNTRQLKMIEQCKEFIENAGYPSLDKAIRQVESGAIQDVQITSADLKNYCSVYDTSSAYWKGKMTHKKISSLSQDESLIENSIPQDFYSDVFTIGGQSFLLSVAWPLSLLIVT